jgi:branched-chain amino acid aminotransferase
MNLCLVENGRIVTPNPVRWNILFGKTLNFLLEVADREDVVPWTFDDIPIKRLLQADEVFLTGTATEVTPVTLVKHGAVNNPSAREIGNGYAGPVTKQLAQFLQHVVHGQRDQYQHFLTPATILKGAGV